MCIEVPTSNVSRTHPTRFDPLCPVVLFPGLYRFLPRQEEVIRWNIQREDVSYIRVIASVP